MPRIRTIKPTFGQDEDLSMLPPETHLLAANLLPYADDEGYFNANPQLVHANCCPLRNDNTDVATSLRLLHESGFICLYTGQDGKTYGHIQKFLQHQRINRPQRSKIRELCANPVNFSEGDDHSLKTHGTFTESSLSAQWGKGREGKGKEGNGISASPRVRSHTAQRFDDFWNAYPRKRDKKKAKQVWSRKNLDDQADTIIADVKARQAKDDQWKRGYIPLATTYLNGERWEDEFSPQSDAPKRSTLAPDSMGRLPHNPDGSPNRAYRGGSFW